MMRTVLAGTLVAAVAAPALGQVGTPLLLKPWAATPEVGPEAAGARLELSGDAFLYGDADIDDTTEELGLWEARSQGRYKITTEPGPGPSVGYEALYLSLDTDDAALPERLVDHAAAFAFGRELNDAWELGLIGGVGYSGTRAFSDGDNVYFLGDLVLNRKLDATSQLSFILNYNGNRSILPDVPLPAVAYSNWANSELVYTIGLPYSVVTWTPDDRWLLEVRFSAPYNLDALVSYEVAEHLSLFGAFDSRYDAFWLEDDEDRRLFFQQRRLEAGVRYQATDGAQLVLAGGYAFGQEFTYGWDSRDTDDVREVDAAPFVRLGLDLAF